VENALASYVTVGGVNGICSPRVATCFKNHIYMEFALHSPLVFPFLVLRHSALPVVPPLPASFSGKDIEWQNPDTSLRTFMMQ